jgi:CPA2 family monovalent cation:H+ antiporter-2
VGCCDSSPHKHASAHYAATGHAMIASAEPGEAWAYCFVDEIQIRTREPVRAEIPTRAEQTPEAAST